MTDTLSVEPRRTKASLRSGRDLPVLFHLMDVSRPRGMAKTLTSAVEEIPEDAEPDLAPALDAVDLREPATKPDSLPPVAQSAPLAHEDLAPPPRALAPAEPAQDTPAPTPVPTSSLAAEASSIGDPPLTHADSAPALDAAAAAFADLPATDEPAISPPQAAEPRAEKATSAAAPESTSLPTPRASRNQASSGWFATHGRYIAIAFVIALVGVIYLGSTSRRGATRVAAPPQEHPGEAMQKKPAAVNSSLATVVGEATASAETKVAKTTGETSPAQLTTQSPQAALYPPTIPQLSAPEVTEAAASAPVDETLFPWVKEEDRVAARPDQPASAPALPSTAPPANDAAESLAAPQGIAPQNAPSAESPPVPAVQYPVTRSPASPAPQPTLPPGFPTSGGQPAYPTTSTPAQYPFPGNAPASSPPAQGPALAPPGGGSQYFPQDNSARGPRYERTGSGLY